MILKQAEAFWFLQEDFKGFSPLVNLVLTQTLAIAGLTAYILPLS